MAQPTETDRQFEVSEPSSALPVPALSRYARPRAKSPHAESPEHPGEENAHAATADTTAESHAPNIDEMSLDEAPGRLADLIDVDRLRTEAPIVQSPHEAWATDPSPPQPVRDARLPALRDPHEQKQEGEDPGRRKPFWKRLSMTRPSAQTQPSAPPALSPDALKPVLERIDHLTRRFEREQKALHERLDQFEHNITRLWELEQQMSLEEVRGQLAVLQANQEEVADGIHALARNVAIGAGLAMTLLAAGVLWAIL